MRLTGLSLRKWQYAHWTFFAILIILTTCSIFLLIFQCTPAKGAWDTIATGHLTTPPRCIAESDLSNPLSIVHIVLDFCLLAVPIVVLWRVQLAWSTKIRLYMLFSVGAVCCFTSVMRQVTQGRLKSDFLYNSSTLVYWTAVDLTLSIVVASLPILGSATYRHTRKKSKPTGASTSFGISKQKSGQASSILHSKHSREGIMRQDEVELEYHTRDPAHLEEGSEDPGQNLSRDAYHVEQQTMVSYISQPISLPLFSEAYLRLTRKQNFMGSEMS